MTAILIQIHPGYSMTPGPAWAPEQQARPGPRQALHATGHTLAWSTQQHLIVHISWGRGCWSEMLDEVITSSNSYCLHISSLTATRFMTTLLLIPDTLPAPPLP